MEKSYINRLKIAVINRDFKALEEVVNTQPEFKTEEEAKEILAYMKEAANILQKEKNRLAEEMNKIKRIKKFNTLQNSKGTFSFKA
ncbi:hypothetical protein [Nautilia sp.]